jgi:eukaryotic-like serine/threonine-protein kinase
MGDVIEAEHRALHKRVVVKILRAEYAASPGMRDRFRLESQALASLDWHPNIVEVLDVGQTPSGRPYLVMERMEGRTLRSELDARGPLPVGEAVGLCRQMLAGLAEAHAIGIVHRDLKPENLFICDPDKNGERILKILDFGIAKVTPKAGGGRAPLPLALPTQKGLALGTPRFLAPEQALGEPVDARADLYAVSAVLYWLLTGRDPFHYRTGVFSVINAHVAETPERPSLLAAQSIPPSLDRIILRGLAKRPEDRFASAEELSAELLRALRAPPAQRWPTTERLDTSRFRTTEPLSTSGFRTTEPLYTSVFQAARAAQGSSGPAALPLRTRMAKVTLLVVALLLLSIGSLIVLLRRAFPLL